MIGERWID
jgi:hypothetical protein